MVKSQPVWSLPPTLASVSGLRIEKPQWVLDIVELASTHKHTCWGRVGGGWGYAPLSLGELAHTLRCLCAVGLGFLVLMGFLVLSRHVTEHWRATS